MSGIRKVAILGGMRIPFARSGTAYKEQSNIDLLTPAFNQLVDKFQLQGELLGEVALGAVMKRSKDFNLAREVVLRSSLSPYTPAFDIQRACGTSLETTIAVANKIALGQIDVGIAGGSDTNSDVPIEVNQNLARTLVQLSRARSWKEYPGLLKDLRPGHLKPAIPAITEPSTGLSMGQHCEKMAQEWEISRADQDELAFKSHQNAVAAYERGFYSDLITPCRGLQRDNNLRPDVSVEKLAKLKPAFDRSPKGTMTAGNSTPLTDGASTVLLASEEWAKSHGLPVLAYVTFAQSSAVDFVNGDGLLMAPTVAVGKLLEHMNKKLQDFDFYEIHEAFAAQALCTLKAWESAEYCKKFLGRDEPLGSIDRDRMNVVGGSVGVGHPFGATGGRLVGTLAKLLAEKGSGSGLISACTAGGMGVVMALEA